MKTWHENLPQKVLIWLAILALIMIVVKQGRDFYYPPCPITPTTPGTVVVKTLILDGPVDLYQRFPGGDLKFLRTIVWDSDQGLIAIGNDPEKPSSTLSPPTPTPEGKKR